MLLVVLVIQIVVLLAVAALWLRKPSSVSEQTDPRLAQLLTADLPAQLARLDARAESTEKYLRNEVGQLRTDNASAAAGLRGEVLTSISTLGETQRTGLENFRTDNSAAAERLRLAVDAQLRTISDRFVNFTSDTTQRHSENREALHALLQELRTTMEARLDALNAANAAKLEEMRATVDEKLHATLQTRLTESFGAVVTQLSEVHKGLGEMTKLSAGVDDLSRIFTNVKSRGTIGEVMLETLLKQMLAANQYVQNAKVKPNTQEIVEFAVKVPTSKGEMLLPIDSKFPREIWERLETAYSTNSDDIVSAGKAFEAAIRNEGKKICEKYIAPPMTTAFAIMFLPTEGLYAEVMRRDGLQTDIQQNCRVTIAGPSTLSAILSSFQMGFHMLQMQEKGDEVWKVLASARTQFGKFEDLMGKMSKDVEKVQNTIGDVATRTRAINRTLRDVSVEEAGAALPATIQTGFDGFLPTLAAAEGAEPDAD